MTSQSFERRFTLNVPSSTDNLVMIRDFVGKIAQQAGLGMNEVAQLELAVDEACANVIEHAYGKDVSKEVEVRAVVDHEAIQIDVIDTGRGFDPGSIETKDLKELVRERRSGGLGMRLMRQLMDEVHYQITPGVKNELRMVKHLKKEPADG